jgi:hypothetical protein
MHGQSFTSGHRKTKGVNGRNQALKLIDSHLVCM